MTFILPHDLLMKEEKLRTNLRHLISSTFPRVLVAFSGGVDSSLLLWECVQALTPEAVMAVTAISATSIPRESEEASRFAGDLNVLHITISTSECESPEFLANPPDRCYVCKRIRYERLTNLARSFRAAAVLDGTQANDDPRDRAGMRALSELRIHTPLADVGIGKKEVRLLLRAAGFDSLSEKPPQPCLATRIPTGAPITVEALRRVAAGEALLQKEGLSLVRLRDHFPLARIVTDNQGIERILNNEAVRERIVEGLKRLGFVHVTLELEAYPYTP